MGFPSNQRAATRVGCRADVLGVCGVGGGCGIELNVADIDGRRGGE